MTRVGERRPDERGETLVELMVTIVIVGIAIVGLTGALAASFRFSTRDRTLADAESILVSYAEQLKALDYEPCGGATEPYEDTAPLALPAAPGRDVHYADAVPPSTDITNAYLVKVDAVRYWNGQTSPADYQLTCPNDGDPGLQEITLRAWAVWMDGDADTSGGQVLTIYKRRP
jgi:prepilin-type N-terminal cleavage/methylation domain-containing protein